MKRDPGVEELGHQGQLRLVFAVHPAGAGQVDPELGVGVHLVGQLERQGDPVVAQDLLVDAVGPLDLVVDEGLVDDVVAGDAAPVAAQDGLGVEPHGGGE